MKNEMIMINIDLETFFLYNSESNETVIIQ